MPYTYQTNEFDRILKQREALWNQTLRSLSNSIIVRQSLMDMPEPQASLQAFDMGSLMTQADPMNQQIRAAEEQSLRQMRDMDDLIGAARFYGIRGAERIPVDELEEMISLRRESLRDLAMNQDISVGRALYNGVATAIGLALTAPGQQTLRIIGNLAERIPFMRDAVARSETMREADRWFSQIQEGLTADLPEERRELSRGVSGAIGMFPAGIWAWRALGALGALPTVARLGSKVTPLGRAMVRGTLAEMAIQDPTAPLSEQAVNAAFGAAFGGAEVIGGVVGRTIMGGGMGAIAGAIADDGDPRTMFLSGLAGAVTLNLGHLAMNKVRRSFPSSAIDADFVPNDWTPPTFDAEIIPEGVAGLLPPAGGSGGTGWRPAGQLPPPGALDGILEDALRPRIGRGQPWLPEESSFLGDADFEVIESPAGIGPATPPTALPLNRSLPPGQYNVYGIGGPPPGAVPNPTAPSDGPSIWMQTPPEVRGFIRRVVGERRAARRAAETDPMTGAGNRAAWARARVSAEGDPSLSIVAFDVNNLKAANDLVGHEFGDQMIMQAATAAQQAAQQIGVAHRFFRLGGDEFVAIVPNDRVAQYIDAVEQLYGGHDAAGYTVSITGGVGNTLEEADHALRAIKAGRDGGTYRNLNGAEAAGEAANLTKQGTVLESPIVADLATVPRLDDADAAWALVESFPGQVGVVQNVGDVASTVRRILQDQMPNGVGPQDFRVVERPVTPLIRRAEALPEIKKGRPRMNFEISTPEGRPVSVETYYDPVDQSLEIAEIRAIDADSIYEAPVSAGVGWAREVGAQLIQQFEQRGLPVSRVWGQRATGARAVGADDDFLAPTVSYSAERLRRPSRKQIDILVSSGRSITNKMVREYETYGMFAGQRAKIPSGQEVVIESLGPEVSRVRPVYGGPSTDVQTSDLLPQKSSAIVEDVPGFYDGFREYSAVRLDQQARESGLAVPLNLFDDDVASQVPYLMEEYIRVNGVDPSGYYGATLRQLLEQRHIEAIRDLATPQETAILRSVQADLAAIEAQVGPSPPVSLEELAAVRGFTVRRGPSGIDLVDDVSKNQVRVPVEDEAAAREFLHSFQREAIDDSPVTPFPLEVMETPPGYSETTGPLPGEWQSADQWADAAEDMLANWFALGGEDMLARMMHPDLGGGAGGGIPPIGPPPSGTFGSPEFPRQLPPVENVYERHAEQWRRARRNDPARMKILLDRMNDIVDRAFVPTRNVIERMLQYSRSLGVSAADYLEQVRALSAGYNRMVNDAHPWEERAFEILNPVRNRFWRDGTFWEAMNAPAHHRDAVMQNAGFNPAERQAVQQMRDLFDEWWRDVASKRYPEMGYQQDYITMYKTFEEGLPGDPFRRPIQAEWGPAQPRGEGPAQIEKNMGAIIPRYFRSFYKVEYMQPIYAHIKRMMAPDEVPEVIREAVLGYADAKMWGLDPTKDVVAQGTHFLLNKLGKPLGESFTMQDVMKLHMTRFNAQYRAGLGGRVDPLIRDLPQGLIGVMQVGLDKGLPVLKRLLRDDAYGEYARELAKRAGWIQEGGGASIDPDVFGASSPGSTALRENVARIADVVQDRILRPLAMRHGIQGTWLDWLAPYGRLGDFARVWNGMVGYESAQAALRKYAAAQASRQSWAVPLEDLQQQLLRESRVSRYQKGIQQTFLDYVNRGDFEGAAQFFGGEVAASQNLYGMAEQPRLWQSAGPVTGKMGMQWLTFNSQTLANLTHIARDKAIPWFGEGGKAGYFVGISALQTAMYAAQKLTSWNFMRMSLLGIGFGVAGQGLFDLINDGQRLLAWWNQFNPAGQPLDPDQRALLGSPGSSYGSPFDPRYSTLNPWAGGLRTIQGVVEGLEWGPESVARFLTTGERGDPFVSRLQSGQVQFGPLSPTQVDEILQGGQGPLAPSQAPPSSPGFGAMY